MRLLDDDADTPADLLEVILFLAEAETQRRRPARALEVLLCALELAARSGDVQQRVRVHVACARALRQAGEQHAAERQLEKAASFGVPGNVGTPVAATEPLYRRARSVYERALGRMPRAAAVESGDAREPTR